MEPNIPAPPEKWGNNFTELSDVTSGFLTLPNLEAYPKIEMSHLAKKVFEDHSSSILGDLSLSQLIRDTHDDYEEDVYSHLEESGNASG